MYDIFIAMKVTDTITFSLQWNCYAQGFFKYLPLSLHIITLTNIYFITMDPFAKSLYKRYTLRIIPLLLPFVVLHKSMLHNCQLNFLTEKNITNFHGLRILSELKKYFH